MSETVQSVQPLNVIGVTLLFQILFVAMLGIAKLLSAAGEEQMRPQKNKEIAAILITTLVSITALLLTNEFYAILQPMFNGATINSFTTSAALLIVFLLDIFLVGYLIISTGGSSNSPFTTALFTLPAIAIFLRMSPNQFMFLTALTAILYLVFLLPIYSMQTQFQRQAFRGGQKATAFINIACLVLSMVTGYITRPTPVNELQPSGKQIGQQLFSKQ